MRATDAAARELPANPRVLTLALALALTLALTQVALLGASDRKSLDLSPYISLYLPIPPYISITQAALLGASDRESLDVSDLVEVVLRWLVLPPVDPAKAPFRARD